MATETTIRVQPIVSLPRRARAGATYMVSVDLRHDTPPAEWPYDREEYALRCVLETRPLFDQEPVGEPWVVLHRFGGTYGAARFLLRAVEDECAGTPRLVLVNEFGLPVQTIELPRVRVTRSVVPEQEGHRVAAGAERMQSVQQKLARERPPRVRITYDVEVDGSIQQRSLPFVIGVIADLGGKARDYDSLPPLAERRFMEIDRDNFDDVLRRLAPELSMRVPNRLAEDDSELAVELRFTSFADFEPARVAAQVPQASALLERRRRLHVLSGTLERRPSLKYALERVLRDETTRLVLSEELNETGTKEADDLSPDDEQQTSDVMDSVDESSPVPSRASEAQSSGAEATRDESDPRSLLDSLLEEISREGREDELAATVDLVRSVWRTASPKNVLGEIIAVVAEIDAALSHPLDAILHHPDFQRLESSWRGLHRLVTETETGSELKIRLLAASKSELAWDAERAAEFDQSALFRHVFELPYGVPASEPFGCVVLDFEFDHRPEDVRLLEHLAKIGAAAHAPCIVSAAPRVFGLTRWEDLPRIEDAGEIFATPEYVPWRALRESEDARFLAVVPTRVLARLPYGMETAPVEEFDYEESVKYPEDRCWTSGAWVLAEVVGRAFVTHGWPAIHGLHGGGLVERLPTWTAGGEEGVAISKAPTEIAVDDQRTFELARFGFTALASPPHTDHGVFLSTPTIASPKTFDDAEADVASGRSAQLDAVLVLSRFAQYIACIARDRIGSFFEAAELEKLLSAWLAAYIDSSPESPMENRVRRPLGEARVEVASASGLPGVYNVTLYLRPHFLLEDVPVSLRTIIRVPASGASGGPA